MDRLLTDLVQKRLVEYGYSESHEIEIESTWSPLNVAVVSTPRRWSVRYLCALLEAPREVCDVSAALLLHQQLRKGITRRFAKFPWLKEIGTYSIVLCATTLFGAVEHHVKRFRDNTGLHMNVMLGTCFVDTQTKANTANATWGLFYSGKHYGALRAAVAQWSETE